MIRFSRLFEPAIKNKKVTFKCMVENAVGVLWFDVVLLISIPLIINAIQSRDVEAGIQISVVSLISFLVLWIIHFKIRHWDFEGKYLYQAYLEKNYRKQIILKDNLALEKLGTGQLQSITQKGMFSWAEANWQIMYQIPRAIMTIGAGIYLTFKFQLLYALIFVGAISISVIVYAFLKKKQMLFKEKSNDLDTEQTAHTIRTIMSRSEIVLSNNVDKEVDRLYGYELKQLPITRSISRYDVLLDITTTSFGMIMPFLLVLSLIFTNKFISTDTTLIVSLVYFASRFTFLMYNLTWTIQVFSDRYPQIKAFWDFLDKTPTFDAYDVGNRFVHKQGDIELKDISFRYDVEQEKSLLQNFSLHIKPGTKIALVGHSGSGKTTVAKLIAGYLKPEKGDILVDGQFLADVSLSSYYRDVGYLTQEPMVFDGSIKENMLYGVSADTSTDSIWEALDMAECSFVREMKDGLETQIGEKGIRLSGGERQRLAIAKLFIKNPKIIILDEPTSALDSFAEDKLTKALHKLFKNRTVIIIAHRLQTVQEADVIYVMDHGHIVESGTHTELVEKKKGIYAQMLKLQAGF